MVSGIVGPPGDVIIDDVAYDVTGWFHGVTATVTYSRDDVTARMESME